MYREELNISGKTLSFETGYLAKQANGSIVIQYGETIVLATAEATKGVEEYRGFFPLSVDFRNKFYAAGKIPGSFLKREARPTDQEVLAARLTDRPLRPLFPDGFVNETQVMITVLSYDGENIADVLGTIAASAAMSISDIPWNGPVASVRIGKVEDKFIINPTVSELKESEMEIVISGTKDSIVMVEGESDFISEDSFISAIQYAHEAIKDIIEIQEKLVSLVGKTKREVIPPAVDEELIAKVDAFCEGKIDQLNQPKNKHDHYGDIATFRDELLEHFAEEYPDNASEIKGRLDELLTADLRAKVLKGQRADGRGLKDIRNIDIRLGYLPRTHGSSVFTRGETQALAVVTLGSKKDEQKIDNLDGIAFKDFMLHYNFPPYSVGEVKRIMGVSRREIGHGNLAERSIRKVLPNPEDFPYTLRIVSEIMESNGSSSMATVCAGSLSLMDAGVPLKSNIAGVAMGLVMEDEENYSILTDILGTEDHLGDMDFKVTGTEEGITAIQMDLKVDGLPIPIMREALSQAKAARLSILNTMNEQIKESRPLLSKHAPKIAQSLIPVDMIGELIGPGGKNIRKLTTDYECEISVEEDGRVILMGMDQEKIDALKAVIDNFGLVPEVGQAYPAKIVKIMDFGAFAQITPRVTGLVHISELKWERVNKVEDVVQMGQDVEVMLKEIDSQGRYNLSMKALMPRPERKPHPKKNFKE